MGSVATHKQGKDYPGAICLMISFENAVESKQRVDSGFCCVSGLWGSDQGKVAQFRAF